MAVFVDQLQDWGLVLNGRRVRSCHMIASSLAELHTMAARIGLRRSWFQASSFPHYDLTKTRRELAIESGAVELDRKAFVLKMREIRSPS